ncbi:hypothetical protein BYT27DRAFT_7215134 [Phlegmacium glaucopus]|nr:hypothetical protein BYT27DRAFT_7215134 [Phlegmacium glaucopus]
MPPNFSLFNIRNHTTMILVDSNLNLIQGDLRHIDRSTTITNTDAFNIELEGLPNEHPSRLTLPLEPTLVSRNPSAERHDADSPSSPSDAVSRLPGTQGPRPVAISAHGTPETSPLASAIEYPHSLHQPPTAALEPQFGPPRPHPTLSSNSDHRETLSSGTRTRNHTQTEFTERNTYTYVYKKFQEWLDRVFNYICLKARYICGPN